MLWRNVPPDERAIFRRVIGLTPGVDVQLLSGTYTAATLTEAIDSLLVDIARVKAVPDPPQIANCELTTDWPDPSCPIAVPLDRARSHYEYKPCSRKAGPDGFCSRHRPEVLRAPLYPCIVGEALYEPCPHPGAEGW